MAVARMRQVSGVLLQVLGSKVMIVRASGSEVNHRSAFVLRLTGVIRSMPRKLGFSIRQDRLHSKTAMLSRMFAELAMINR